MFASRHATALPPDVLAAVAAAYADPPRAYHNAAHVDEVLRWFDWVGDELGWDQPQDVYLAVVFHDAIYVAGAPDNEARSAQLARTLGGASDRTVELIELTARHGKLDPDDVDRDAGLFLDCDTAILGATPDEFDRYDAAIRREYAAIPDAAFRAGRGAFLTAMLARPRIFLSELFHARLDAAARANLRRLLARYRDAAVNPGPP